MKRPNFFIIGAPRCETTSLYMWLREHPNIHMSPVKEPHFYSTDLRPSPLFPVYNVAREWRWPAMRKMLKVIWAAVLFAEKAVGISLPKMVGFFGEPS